MARHEQTIRVLRLALMLRHRATTVEEIMAAMHVTQRTVYRDLAAIQAVGFPLADIGRYPKRWKVTGPSPLTDAGRQ